MDMFCSKCGHEIAQGAVFCQDCGSEVRHKSGIDASTLPIDQGGSLGQSITAKRRKLSTVLIVVVALLAVVAVLALALINNTSKGVAPKESVNDYTWEELSQISAEIAKSGDGPAAVDIAKKFNLVTPEGRLDGNQCKTITCEDGSQFDVQIAGFIHDDRPGGGKAGITFIFKDPIFYSYINWTNADEAYADENGVYGDVVNLDANYENLGGWTSSELRRRINDEGLGFLPSDMESVMVPVLKKTNSIKGSNSSSAVQIDSDLLWLYSLVELAGDSPILDGDNSALSYYNEVLNAEGSQYQLFADMDVRQSGDNDILAKGGEWFTRSLMPFTSYERDGGVLVGPDTVSSSERPLKIDLYYSVSDAGNPSARFAFPTSWGGIVPGFCI